MAGGEGEAPMADEQWYVKVLQIASLRKVFESHIAVVTFVLVLYSEWKLTWITAWSPTYFLALKISSHPLWGYNFLFFFYNFQCVETLALHSYLSSSISESENSLCTLYCNADFYFIFDSLILKDHIDAQAPATRIYYRFETVICFSMVHSKPQRTQNKRIKKEAKK